jgi:MYXO-CTERM domain-containing protein
MTHEAPEDTGKRLPLLCAIAVAAGLTFNTTEAAAEPFTIVVLPDTQTEMTNIPQEKFPAMMSWVVDNRTEKNIQFVVHVGDVVNWDTPNSTPPHFMYVNADAGFDLLDSVGLPYAIALGNHDTAAVGGTNPDGTPCYCGGSAAPGDVHANLRNTDTYNLFFPPSRFASCKDRFEAGKMDNAYHTFSAGGLDWLVINTELDPRQGAVDWFNGVVAAHPNHNVIYVTHSFLSGSATVMGGCGYGDLIPSEVWDQLLKVHANMRFVLSGHVSSSARRETPGDQGNTVYQMLTDWQSEGNGWLRTLEIDTDAKTVKAQTYSPYLDQHKTGPDDAFTLTDVAFVPATVVPPSAQCADGQDNDGDGAIDLDDPGCTSASDEDESDDPSTLPKPRVDALPAGSIQVDGSLDDWAGATWTTIASPADYETVTGSPGGPDDLSASFASLWTGSALYLAAEVTDDTHESTEAAETLWRGDSLQVAFDIARNGGTSYDTTDDYEFGWATTANGPVTHTWRRPDGSTSAPMPFAVRREGATTRYEVQIDATALGIAALQEGMVVGFGLLVNDNDGAGREGWVQWAAGIGGDKRPEDFGELALRDAQAPDGGAGGEGAGGTGGESATGGSGGNTPEPDAGVGGSAQSTPGEQPTGEEGCGCSVVGTRGTSVLWVAAIGALLLALRRRSS